LTNRIIKNKKENFEEIDSESDSDGEEKKAHEEMTVAEIIAYEEKQAQLNEELAYEK